MRCREANKPLALNPNRRDNFEQGYIALFLWFYTGSM